jgi:hypothetical protein
MTARRTALVAATMAALLVLGGVALAAIPSSDGTIYACVTKDGGLRLIDFEAGQRCDKTKETLLKWNQQGPQGPSGPAGPQGERGPSDAFFATASATLSANEPFQEIVHVDLPAGKFVVTADVSSGLNGFASPDEAPPTTACGLDIFQGGQPQSGVAVGAQQFSSTRNADSASVTWHAELTAPGRAVVSCRFLVFSDRPLTDALFADIHAIQVGNLTFAGS